MFGVLDHHPQKRSHFEWSIWKAYNTGLHGYDDPIFRIYLYYYIIIYYIYSITIIRYIYMYIYIDVYIYIYTHLEWSVAEKVGTMKWLVHDPSEICRSSPFVDHGNRRGWVPPWVEPTCFLLNLPHGRFMKNHHNIH